MLLQLGNKIFDGLFVPDSLSYSGNEANLAQYELINTKPRLQHTGETLEELSISIHLIADVVALTGSTIDVEVSDFEKWKKDGEVLPLLLGTGEYKGDYVLKSVSKYINRVLSDGSITDASVTLSLLEYVSEAVEEQQATDDRRNATAVGDKKQVNRRPAQPKTPEAQAHAALMRAQTEAWDAANAAEKMKDATNPEEHISEVKRKVAQAQKDMSDAGQKVNDAQASINNATGVIASIRHTADKITELGSLLAPPISTQNIDNAIGNLQSGLSDMDASSVLFTNDIILRKI